MSCVSVHVDDVTVDKQITSMKTDRGTYSLNASLSQGPEYRDFQQTIIVKIRDALGSIQEFDCLDVVVSLPMCADILYTI